MGSYKIPVVVAKPKLLRERRRDLQTAKSSNKTV